MNNIPPSYQRMKNFQYPFIISKSNKTTRAYVWKNAVELNISNKVEYENICINK